MSKNKFTEMYAPPCKLKKDGTLNATDDYYDDLLEYIQVGLNNEKTFLRSCRAFRKAELGMSVLYGDTFRKDFKGPSTLQIRKSRRQTREAIANQSDIRQNWQIRTTKTADALYQDQADDYNRLSKDWWSTLFVDRVVKGAQQYAGGYGTGYLFLWPDTNPITGETDIIPHYLDYKSVLVGHIPADNDIQKAYRLDIIMEYPLPLAHRKWPDHVGIIGPDTEIPARMVRNFERARKVYRGLFDWMGKNKRNSNSNVSNPFPCARIVYSFIDDDTINETGKTVSMGELGSHWYYEVPSYIDPEGNINRVKTGINIPEEAERDIKREECKLYPCGRLIISCTNGILYDGPPQWGDGTKPVTQFYFDKVAGEFLGFPVAMDSISIENSVNNIYQAMEDSVLGKINPPFGIDSSIPEPIAQQIKSLGLRGMIGKGIQYSVAHLSKAIVSFVDPSHWNIESNTFKLVEMLQAMQDYLSGTQDWQGAASLKQTPSDDTQEALLRKLGVLSTDQAREQEKSFMYLGRIWLSFADQVYTLKRRLQIIGSDALKPEYMDFDPNKFEKVYKDDPRPRWIVRREHKKNFSVYVSPNSVQERQSMQNKLALLQVRKMEVPISDRKIYDTFIGDDMYEKVRDEFFAEQKQKAEAAARIQVELEKITQTLQGGDGTTNKSGAPNPIIQQIAEELVQRFTGNNVGRPPTNSAAAHLEQKTREGIPDVTLSTS